MTIIENSDLSEMVPELGKLLGHLKMGNLTKLEFEELEKQLKKEENNNEGKENTSPLPSSHSPHQNEKEIGDDIINNRKEKPINKQKASRRNLAALRRGLFDENLTDEETNKNENFLKNLLFVYFLN
ncbi:unnamed protein product [Meloidogyne enterolobii]|uniref:Uncharacterized protein n=1 Tax=Meloidogyne enterolobii TaxID=390850 RepID=A0ACB0YPC9_MELEN